MNGSKFTISKYCINTMKVIEPNKNLYVHMKLSFINSGVVLQFKAIPDFNILKGVIEWNQGTNWVFRVEKQGYR